MFVETSTDLKLFLGTLNETPSMLLTVSGLPSSWMFEISRVPYHTSGGEVLTVNEIPMVSSEMRMFKDKW